MKTPLFPKALLVMAFTAGLSMTSASAQSWDFAVFESSGAKSGNLNQITLAAHLIDTGSGVEIQVANDSVPGGGWISTWTPTITSLYFENASELLIAPSFNAVGSIGGIDYDLRSGGNLPGGRNIDFGTAFSFRPDSPPVVNGVNPSEMASFVFAGSSYAEVLAALNRGEIRIGAHVQQIGPHDDSASFVTQVPEPGSALLALLGTLLLLRRQR